MYWNMKYSTSDSLRPIAATQNIWTKRGWNWILMKSLVCSSRALHFSLTAKGVKVKGSWGDHNKNCFCKVSTINANVFLILSELWSSLDIKHLEGVCYYFKLVANSFPSSFICSHNQGVKSPCTQGHPSLLHLNMRSSELKAYILLILWYGRA